MNQTAVEQVNKNTSQFINLNWKDNLSVQKLLDVIASIIADEYIQIAKQNKDVFEIASPPKADHNDDGGEK